MNRFIYQPIRFFLVTFVITYFFLIFAAYISWHNGFQYLLFPLILWGMSGPTISALLILFQSKNKNLRKDFLQRFYFGKIKLSFMPIVLLFFPCLILFSITISLLFGFSLNQFSLIFSLPDQALKGHSFLAILITVFLSCTLEEVGWRGYGIDSLRNKFNLFKTSLIFSGIWALWHIPAFLIRNGYFQKEVWNLGIGYTANYFIMLFPVTILINWAYIKNNRSILIAIFSHAIMNISFAIFQIEPFTRVILMILLLIFATLVVIKDKELFFTRYFRNN